VRVIRGYSGAARILRVAHELGRPLLLELTPPVSTTGKGILGSTDGSKGVGGAHSSIDTGDNITPEERRGPAMKSISKERRIFTLANESSPEKKRKKSEMTDDERVRDFQRKLYRKAKQEPGFRFYVLYDKIGHLHFLREAYRRVKSSRGAPGIDGITFEQIEEEGVEALLLELQEELQQKTYRPQPVKRVYIPKANGEVRPLGIPTIRDRVAQMSCKLVIEPIFEADFDDASYGFRPKRSAADAVKTIKEKLKEGKTEVLDADLSKYFDTIPHDKLLKLIALRISDTHVLHLIKLWLKTPVIEEGKMSGGKKHKVGTPQGGVISPLLANIYLNLVDRLVRNHKVFSGIDMVRYADDFVLMSRKVGERVLNALTSLLERMELTLNKDKTRLIQVREEPFDFLGFTYHYRKSRYVKDESYLSVHPSKKAFQKLVAGIRDELIAYRNRNSKDTVKMLNYKLRGWLNYFTIEGVTYTGITRRKLTMYLRDRLFRHQKRKSQRYRYAYCRGTFRRWVEQEGLVHPGSYGIEETAKA
jgi:RNA-directed DNA polymerase